jgi:hypothetical protein
LFAFRQRRNAFACFLNGRLFTKSPIHKPFLDNASQRLISAGLIVVAQFNAVRRGEAKRRSPARQIFP